MTKNLIWIIIILFSLKVQAQYKPDVIVLGSTAAGVSAAIQAARSGVNTLLIDEGSNLIGELSPVMDVPAFDTGLWKEWKDAYKKANDSIPTDARVVLENIIKKTKNLQYLKGVNIDDIDEKKKGWEITLRINGKKEDIRCKVLVDANTDSKNSPSSNFINYDDNGNFLSLVNYDYKQQQDPYSSIQKLYRTSAAVGFGKDSTLHFIPLGSFIPQDKENLLIVSTAGFKDFEVDDFKNIAIWVNMGQAVGALAAYGPFFDTTPSKASIRMTQGEMFTYKSSLYPVTDISVQDSSWYPIQKIIASGILKLDFKTGHFHPDFGVNVSDVKDIMANLYPRSRIWFIENKTVNTFSIADFISLISFTMGTDPITLRQTIETDWNKNYHFGENFDESSVINRKEFAVLFNNYLEPFNIGVDFNGYFIK